jgi:SAM-dependent methyltransferase
METDSRVLDIGAGEYPVPEATATLDQRPVADYQADIEDDWPLPDNSVDHVVARHVLEHVSDPAHVFREAGRVLVTGGSFRITVPLGEDAHTDHDHETVWRYCTPEQFCVDQQRPWDPDVPFRLMRREIETRLGGPLRPLTPLFRWAEQYWPAWAAHRCFAGELTAVFMRVSDDA